MLPEHRGFEQLANIREKLADYKEAIRRNKEALRQGWAGDWKMRIDRCEKKLAKVDQGSSRLECGSLARAQEDTFSFATPSLASIFNVKFEPKAILLAEWFTASYSVPE